MLIDVEHRADATTLVVQGDVDVTSAYDLYVAAIGQGETDKRVVTLDLAGVSFIDSVGLSMLIRSRDELRSGGGQLVLQHPSRQVKNLLAVTALDGQFQILD
ncbi:STAS domain-containing protein [uncultured Jatrophihabitans sp.]|uniref:STAS domain-containing protein n=1 Tax=uncultured Jatrophihabitans sp. TaxID=1610747 RepID=UPI0035CB29E5